MTLLLQDGVGGRPVYRWSVADYVRAIEAGQFAPEYRAELIDGLIIEKMPIGTPHAYATTVLNDVLRDALPREEYSVRSQNPIALPPDSRPEPDVAVARGTTRDYAHRDPTPTDLLLVVEVSDSTLRFDIGTKLPIYAEAGIREYWIVDIPNSLLHVHTSPASEAGYANVEVYRRGETLQHALFGGVDVAELFAT